MTNETDQPNNLVCPKCESDQLIRAGFTIISGGGQKQKYRCKNCGYCGVGVILTETS